LISVFPNEEYIVDLLASYLGEIDFESFESTDNGMIAYIQEDNFDEELMKNLFNNFPYSSKIQYEVVYVEQKNWNEEWEKHYFEPIIIDNACVIRSSFHKNTPSVQYEIIIDPKMSFGTGHHETTSLMISWLLSTDIENKSLLDMGCGTAVLAILAAMKGADPIMAIDIDPWCVENSIENIQKNKVNQIQVKLGDASVLGNEKYDVILANINRNILLEDIKYYKNCLNTNGLLFMSGFYREDIPLIEKESALNGLILTDFVEKNNWVAVKTIKKA
jgi:ribosomal protein L11 methyltransferase